MAATNIEIQDENGQIYNPKTIAENVVAADGKTVEAKLAEIAAGIALDFDVLCSSKGYSCATIKSGSSSTETLTKTVTGKKAAVRATTKLSNGYTDVVTFYGEDGVAEMEKRTKTITKTSNGYMEVTA